MDEYKKIYDDIKKIINKFIKNNYFMTFNKLLFINNFDNEGDIICRFVNDFYVKYNALEFYYTNDGYNYLADSMNTPKEFDRFFDLDGIIIMLLPSESLTRDDGDYIHSLGYKIKKENNILIYKYTTGKGRQVPTLYELKVVFDNIDYMDSLIKGNTNDLINAIDCDRCASSIVSRDKLEYSVSYLKNPSLEYKVKFNKANEYFIKECKNKTYYGDAYLFTSYYPMVIKETNVRPLIITYLVPNKRINVRYITTSRSTYKDVIYGLLDSIFDSVGFMPEKLYIDNRDLLAILKNTLKELHIEFELVANTLDPLKDKLLFKESEMTLKPGAYDDSSDVQLKKDVEIFLNYVTSAVQNMELDGKTFDLDREMEEVLESDDDYNYDPNDGNDTDLVA